MPKKPVITPKLTFQAGEIVVITSSDREYNFSGRFYPDKSRFAFAFIEEVLPDGSVIIKDIKGNTFKYRQAYVTEFGTLYLEDFFRVDRVEKGKSPRLKTFVRDGRDSYYIRNEVSLMDTYPTFLFKNTEEWRKKATEWEESALAQKKARDEEEAAANARYNRRKPFIDAFKAEHDPKYDAFWREECELWKKHVCAHCVHNTNGYCGKRKEPLENMHYLCFSECSDFDTKEEEE